MKIGLIVAAACFLTACEERMSGAEIATACGGGGEFDPQERVRACDEMLDLYEEGSGGYAATLTWRGRARERGGDSVGALADYDSALAIKPDLANAMLGRGRVLLEADNYAAAEQTLRQAIELHGSGIAADILGGYALQHGDYQSAITYYNGMLDNEHPDDDVIGFYGRGIARMRMGDEEGRADIERARAEFPDVDRRFVERGIAAP